MIQELRTGGAEHVVVALARELHRAGHEVAVAAAPGELVPDVRDVGSWWELPVLSRQLRSVPGGAAAVRRAIGAFRPDIVHAHNPGMALLVRGATLAGASPPGLCTIHGLPDGQWWRTAGILRVSGLPVVACGRGVATSLAEHRVTPYACIPNGVSPPPAPRPRDQVLAEVGISPRATVIATTGRLVPVKNHATLVRAMTELPDSVTLLVVGDGPEAGNLSELADRTGVAGRVVFAGRRPARQLMAAADVNVFPSLSEGLPLALVEAMSAGVPVVASDVRGHRELVTDGESGLLVAPHDVTGFAVALSRVLGDAESGRALADGARRAAAPLTETAMTERYLQTYRTLCARSGGAPG